MAANISKDFLFGPQLSGRFDFTLRFEDWIMVILPTIFLILVTPFYLRRLVLEPAVVRPGLLLRAKLLLGICLVIAEIITVAFWSVSNSYHNDISLVGAGLSCVSALCVVIMLYTEHIHSIRSSTLISIYLSVTLLADITRTRSYFLREGLKAVGIVSIVTVLLKVIVVVLEEVSKRDLVHGDLRLLAGAEAFTGFWNRALLLWLNSTFVRGFRTVININDLQELPPEFHSHIVSAEFRQSREQCNQETVWGLLRACLKALGSRVYSVIIPRLFFLGLSFCQPFLFDRVITTAGQENVATDIINGLVGGGALLFFTIGISANYYRQLINRQMTLLRGYLISAIYRKMTLLNYSEVQQSAAITLMNTDVDGITRGYRTFHEVWASIAGVAVGVYALSVFIGPACVLVLIPVVITTSISVRLATKMDPAERVWNDAIEHRVAGTSDVLRQMKSIRMSGLTDVISDFLQGLLNLEIILCNKARKLLSVSYTLGSAADMLTPVVIVAGGLFWTKSSTGFSTAQIYVSLSVVSLISEPLLCLITSSTRLSAALGCLRRIHAFLYLGELNDVRENPADLVAEKVLRTSTERQRHNASLQGIEIIGASSVPLPNGTQVLTDITIRCDPQLTTMIVGPVGCGKSTLLNLMLGETQTIEGRVVVSATSISFCGQTVWIRNVSIKENIVGEGVYSDLLYEAVLFACHLIEDLRQMRDGDETLAGTGGCNLSGGQKQRVALARVIYINKGILILDDVFSSLDKVTAAIIFRRLFGPQGILKGAGTTVVMTTNLAEHLAYADQVLSMDEHGRIRKLDKNDEVFKQKFLQHESELHSEDETEGPNGKFATNLPDNVNPAHHLPKNDNQAAFQHGDFSLYWYYIKTFGVTKAIIWLILTAMSSSLERIPGIFVRIWFSVDPGNKLYFIGYASIALTATIFLAIMIVFFCVHMITSSYEKLHETLLRTVMNSTWTFFSSTDSGKLLNRFSQDMSLINQQLPFNALQTTFAFFTVMVDLGIIASGNKYGAIVIPFFLLFLYVLQKFYLRTSRQLRILDLEAKSPLVTLFTEVSLGIQHIRAFQWQGAFENRMIALLNQSQRPFYNLLSVQQWLRLVLDMCSTALATTIIALALRLSSSEAGIGLALLSLITFSGSVNEVLNAWVQLETSLGVIARLKSFEKDTPSEMNQAIDSAQIASLASWPATGNIQFDWMSARYNSMDRSSPRALDSITFSAKPGQKIGICGLTGSGKTTILLTMLNFLEYSGSILIDGIEARGIPPQLLRSRITTIPQDVVEMAGSVRRNLYPFNHELALRVSISQETPRDGIGEDHANPDDLKSADALMIDILTRIGIWNHIESLGGGLDADLKALNLSQGQKQLIGLARAMVHHCRTNSKIAIMDEVTSHLDYDTDRRVQRVMNEVFADCTMLVVTHRDETIRNMDAIVEMSKGRVIFFGPRKFPLSIRSTASGSAHQESIQ